MVKEQIANEDKKKSLTVALYVISEVRQLN